MKAICLLAAIFLMGMASSAQETSPEPIQKLDIRTPTLEQIEAFLLAYPPDPVGNFFTAFQGFYNENGDFYGFRWYTDIEPIRYIDMNGDDELDLVVEGIEHIAVMLWIGDEYTPPFQIFYSRGPRNPWSRTLLEDWTNDGIPEIVFDHRTALGGTGVTNDFWIRYIIHCENKCGVVWEGKTAEYRYTDELFDGLMLIRTSMVLSTKNDKPMIETTTHEFAFNCGYVCTLEYDIPIPEGEVFQTNWFRKGATITRQYTWNRTEFQLTHVATLSNATAMNIPSQYSDTHAGMRASIRAKWTEVGFPGNMTRPSQHCQVTVNNFEIGSLFLCLFPYVEWLDVTADGIPELVVTAYSGRFGVMEGEKDCAHQRVLIFEVTEGEFRNGDQVRQIAHLTGCISQPDLFGVRLENVDDDPELEIIASGELFFHPEEIPPFGRTYWYELNDEVEIYDWNGEVFEFTESKPS